MSVCNVGGAVFKYVSGNQAKILWMNWAWDLGWCGDVGELVGG
jgi:hypothetical protein